jgi:flagellar protein FlaI
MGKRKGGFGKYRIIPDKNLSVIIGNKPLSPSQMTKNLWNYIKSKKLSVEHLKKPKIKRKRIHAKPRKIKVIKKPEIKKRIIKPKPKKKGLLAEIKSMFPKKEKIKIPEFLEIKEVKPEFKEIPPIIPPLPAEKEEAKKLLAKPRTGIQYSLIPPFASVDIRWDENAKEFVYNLIEPELSEEEKSIYEKIVNGLLEILDIELSAIKIKSEAVKYLEDRIKKILEEYEITISDETYDKILYYIDRNFVGLNELEPLIQDPQIEDISCDGVGVPIFVVHRRYGSIKTNIVYNDEKKLKEFIVKLAERCGRFVSYAEPLLDGTLPDGSRVQSVFAKDVTTRGPSFTIRKFVKEPFSPVDLLNKNTVGSQILAYLWIAIENEFSILITGGAGTGKTTLLNALLMFVPPESKIITIEDTRELNIPHENWVPAVTRVGFAKGYGEVTMFDLLKESFRQTPDYVVVGEVRGEEAYVMFQGMASGIPAMGTMHAGRYEDVIYRLETPPINLSPSLVDTLDVILVMIHAREKGESARRLKEVVEIESIDKETGNARTSTPYRWLPNEDSFEYTGSSYLLQEMAAHKGVELADIQKEMNNRKKLLEWMKENNITNFKDVTALFREYRKNPEKVLKDAGI